MYQIKVDLDKEPATYFLVRHHGTLQEYAMNFLHLYNNAREYSNMIHKIQNIRDTNDVMVWCDRNCKKNVREYLEQMYEIVNEEDCEVVNPSVAFEDWDDDYFDFVEGCIMLGIE